METNNNKDVKELKKTGNSKRLCNSCNLFCCCYRCCLTYNILQYSSLCAKTNKRNTIVKTNVRRGVRIPRFTWETINKYDEKYLQYGKGASDAEATPQYCWTTYWWIESIDVRCQGRSIFITTKFQSKISDLLQRSFCLMQCILFLNIKKKTKILDAILVVYLDRFFVIVRYTIAESFILRTKIKLLFTLSIECAT